jgi:hypothetical protein
MLRIMYTVMKEDICAGLYFPEAKSTNTCRAVSLVRE